MSNQSTVKRKEKTKEKEGKRGKMYELLHFIAANGSFTQTTGESGKLLQMIMEL